MLLRWKLALLKRPFGHGEHVSPKPIVSLSKGPPCARHQPLWIDHVWRRVEMHMDQEIGKTRHEMSRPPRVIEVNMRKKQVPNIRKSHPQPR